jgi:hypothetical protein
VCRLIRRPHETIQTKDHITPLSYEAELIALAAIFYLYDSSVLLYSNEAILICDRARRWSATSGLNQFLLAGRSLCVLNPLTPNRPSFRLNWDFDALESRADGDSWADRAQEFNKLSPFCLTAGIALFVILPLGMFTPLGAFAVAPALVLLYGSILMALIQLGRKRATVLLGRKRFWGIVFECLACPPFGVNMVRHITLGVQIPEPLPLAAVRLLDTARWGLLRDRCISRIDDAIQLVAEDSVERKALEAQKQRLCDLVSGA